MTKTWTLEQDGENYTVVASYTFFSGKLTVKIGESEYSMPKKFLAGIFGRKESLMLGDKLAIFRQKPFLGAVLITAKGELR